MCRIIALVLLLVPVSTAAADPACVGVPHLSACVEHTDECNGAECRDCVAATVHDVHVSRCRTTPTDPSSLDDRGMQVVREAYDTAGRVKLLPYVIDCEHAETNCLPPLP